VTLDDKGHAMPECACLACGKRLDRATSVDGNHQPEMGDVTICIGCGHLMGFDDDLRLRELTDTEMVKVAGDRRIIAIQRARIGLRLADD
jgi:hypothetical protein